MRSDGAGPRDDASERFEPIRVLQLLRELHRRSYQRLRLHCGWSLNGMTWRYGVASVEDFEPEGFHMCAERYPGRAFKSSKENGGYKVDIMVECTYRGGGDGSQPQVRTRARARARIG